MGFFKMEKSLGTRHAVKRDNLSHSVAIGRRVMNAVRKLQGKKGISLHDLKKYLRDEKNIDIAAYNADINMALKNGVDKGLLIRESGNYKARETKRRRSRSRSKGGKRRSRRSSSRRKRSSSRRRKGSRRRRRRKAAPEAEA